MPGRLRVAPGKAHVCVMQEGLTWWHIKDISETAGHLSWLRLAEGRKLAGIDARSQR